LLADGVFIGNRTLRTYLMQRLIEDFRLVLYGAVPEKIGFARDSLLGVEWIRTSGSARDKKASVPRLRFDPASVNPPTAVAKNEPRRLAAEAGDNRLRLQRQ
jgi:hypothetical protein